jgi:23S rRNA (adenine2030-N6)-methyltransferase
VAILLHLAKKDTPFAVIDSHAGRGSYDLSGEEARKTGEAAGGIEKLRGLSADGALGRYLELTHDNAAYPGSPLIAVKLLRPQDRLVAVEKHAEEFTALKQALHPWRKARVEAGDGYDRLRALLPPPERRGLVLIDPPFEAEDEFAAMAEALRGALQRFANGIYLVWFPVKSESEVRRFLGEVLALGVVKALRIDIAIDAAEGKLARAALLTINPPFGFAEEMQESLDRVTPMLAGRSSLEWLIGQES